MTTTTTAPTNLIALHLAVRDLLQARRLDDETPINLESLGGVLLTRRPSPGGPEEWMIEFPELRYFTATRRDYHPHEMPEAIIIAQMLRNVQVDIAGRREQIAWSITSQTGRADALDMLEDRLAEWSRTGTRPILITLQPPLLAILSRVRPDSLNYAKTYMGISVDVIDKQPAPVLIWDQEGRPTAL